MKELENTNLIPLYQNLEQFAMHHKKEAAREILEYLKLWFNEQEKHPVQDNPESIAFARGWRFAALDIIGLLESFSMSEFDELRLKFINKLAKNKSAP